MKNITVVVPTSAIKSHPDTYHIDNAIESVRYHLPNAEIIITFDGIHQDFKHYEDRYNEYKNKVLWKCLHKWNNVLPLVMQQHEHQSGMMHEAIKKIKTPYLLYLEHDTALTTDRKIDWNSCIDMLDSGKAYNIRFHFEEVIPEPHKSLMIGQPENGFQKTIQWSQRPKLSTKTYYEFLISKFPRDAQSFIEDYWHGVVQNDYYADGMHGWYKHRLWIYHNADSLGIKRSYTTDGRGSDHKIGEGF